MLFQEEVKKIADLARIHLTTDELERIGAELSVIVKYIAVLDEADTKNVIPMNGGVTHMNRARHDAKTERTAELCSPEESALLVNAAPAKERGYVKVKSVF